MLQARPVHSEQHFQTQVLKDRHLDLDLGSHMNVVYFAEVQLPEKGGGYRHLVALEKEPNFRYPSREE